MATLYRTDDAVSFCSRKYSCHSIALGENTKKLNRDITGMLERLFQRIFMRKGLLWKNTTVRRIRLGDGENPMTEEMNIPDSDIRICHIQNGSCN